MTWAVRDRSCLPGLSERQKMYWSKVRRTPKVWRQLFAQGQQEHEDLLGSYIFDNNHRITKQSVFEIVPSVATSLDYAARIRWGRRRRRTRKSLRLQITTCTISLHSGAIRCFNSVDVCVNYTPTPRRKTANGGSQWQNTTCSIKKSLQVTDWRCSRLW